MAGLTGTAEANGATVVAGPVSEENVIGGAGCADCAAHSGGANGTGAAGAAGVAGIVGGAGEESATTGTDAPQTALILRIVLVPTFFCKSSLKV
mmetsp:Transcript_17235/g.36601  ORF Transcript_17235/g.36601 Transcript_17235/m.36601 type:complete len:94 (-) Transcript_17235:40-321(-)